jgi:phosphoserine/homoserine phosphotransferase
MYIICLDLEGVFTPEIWINVAEKTGIKELRLTTRDISDYNVLMKKRLAILDEHNLKIDDIQNVISGIQPLEGAVAFLDWLRAQMPVIIVSDTFVQFADPLLEKLGRPTLFCNTLSIDPNGRITDYQLRQQDGKRKVVMALKNLKYRVIAAGDSYNDMSMLQEAHRGLLFRPPENVIQEFPEFPVFNEYEDIKAAILQELRAN